MFTFISFILVISVLVLVHEFGHFWAAKRAGMKVEEFGIGFPPRLFSWKRGETTYSLNAIFFGGFVRIYGEDGEHRKAPRSFGGGTFFQRLRVMVAGVAMNMLFAALLLSLGNAVGLRVGIFDAADVGRASDVQVQVLQVSAGSPAEKAGVLSLDHIIGFRQGTDIIRADSPEIVQQYAYAHAGSPVTMVIAREGIQQDVSLQLRVPSAGQGPIGISLALTGLVRYPWYEAMWRGLVTTLLVAWQTLVGYAQLLAGLFTSGHLAADVSGPLGIATMTGEAARVGWSYLLQFVAMISINLAVLNILPFPALDGGRVTLLLAERIRGRALSEVVERSINAAGFLLLIALMVAVTIRDVVKIF